MAHRGRPRMVLWMVGATGCAVVLGVGSLLLAVTRFGRVVTITVEQGFVGVYWGGDPSCRNSGVDNHFSAPWSPGRGIGRSFTEGLTWAVYGPGKIVRPAEWRDAIRYGAFFNCVLGCWPPTCTFASGGGNLILPTWLLLLVSAAATTFVWRRAQVNPERNGCRKCGYNLTGNVSGVCPECGTAVEPEGDTG